MKKDIINRIILIVSASLLFISSLVLIILSNIHHGKKYVYEGSAFLINSETSNYEVVDEKVIIEFLNDKEFKLTHKKGNKEKTYDCVYIRLEGNYIKVHGVESSFSGTLYVDSFNMKDVTSYSTEVPANRVFVCKTNFVWKIILTIIIIICSILFIYEAIYHLVDFINWKKYLKEHKKDNLTIDNEIA